MENADVMQKIATTAKDAIAKRLRSETAVIEVLLPLINQALAEWRTHVAIHEVIANAGMTMTLGSYQVAIKRLRARASVKNQMRASARQTNTVQQIRGEEEAPLPAQDLIEAKGTETDPSRHESDIGVTLRSEFIDHFKIIKEAEAIAQMDYRKRAREKLKSR